MFSRKKMFQAAACLLVIAAVLAVLPFAAVAGDNEDIPAPTGEGRVLCLKPNENWLSGDAWFALYFFDYNDNYDWIAMTDEDGDGIYQGVLPQQYPNFLFYRLDCAAAEFDGEYVLNQTDCFEYVPEYSLFVLEEGSWEAGQWEAAEGAEAEETETEPVTEPVTAPATEPVTEPVTEPATEPEATEAPEVEAEPEVTEAPEAEPEATEESTAPAQE